MRECIARYGGFVYTLARRFLGHTADADDAVQEVFIELWKHATRFDPAVGSEWTFVTVLARRRLIDSRRRLTRRPRPAPLPDTLAGAGTTNRLANLDEAARARDALAELRDEQRQVILLAVDGGLTHEEIAQTTGLPVGTVKTHIRRGLQKVREKLSATTGGQTP